MADPIEEFLRRVAQHRRQQVQDDDDIIDAEVIEDDDEIGVLGSESRSIAEPLERQVGSMDFDQRASRLGAAVDASDDRMEAHLHDVFEHKLGELGATTCRASDSSLDDDSKPDKTTGGFDVKRWLRSPNHLRDAILLNEILRRPEHRW